MTITIKADNINIPVETVRFSDGAINLRIVPPEGFEVKSYVTITLGPDSNCTEALFEILLARNAVHHTFTNIPELNLDLRYLPHARADRSFEYGNGNPLLVFATAIGNSMFDNIFLLDPHSGKFVEYLDCNSTFTELIVTEQHTCFMNTVFGLQSGDVLISPDKGASKKIYKLQQALDYKGIATFVVQADKKRDIETGRIIETTLPEGTDLTGKRVVIVDDLLDAGGTFIPLANKLKEAGAEGVELYITHGIFAKGLELFKGVIDKIHCYQIISNYITKQDLTKFNNQ